MGNHDKALADLTQAIKLHPDRAEVYIRRGDIYLQRRDLDAAISDYTQAIRLKSDDISIYQAYLYRGMAYTLKGDMKRAEADRAKAKALGNALKNSRKNRD